MAGREWCGGIFWMWTWMLGLLVLQSFGQAREELRNCTVKYRPNLLCHVQNMNVCPPLTVVRDKWPPPPAKFTMGTYIDEYEYNGKLYLRPGLKFTWKPPQNIGADYVTGFELMIKNVKGQNPNKERCFTFNLTDQIQDLTTTFQHKVFPVESATTMIAILHSLPKPDPNFSEQDNMAIQQVKTPSASVKNETVSADWRFGMNVGNDSCTRQVTCTFTVPPEELNFTLISAHLVVNGSTNIFATKTVQLPSHHAVFESVPPETYDVRLEAFDKYWNDPQRCLCRNKLKECYRCLQTISEKFEIVSNHESCPSGDTTVQPQVSSSDTTAQPPANSPTTVSTVSTEVDMTAVTPTDDQTWKYVVGPIIGILIAAILVALLILALKNYDLKCWKEKPNLYRIDPNKPGLDSSQENNNVAKTSPFLRERVIYLVYTDDHMYHQKAVKMFARYLNKYCRCIVRYPDWCLQDIQARGTISWVLQAIQDADYVIIINSEGAFNLHKARKENSTPCRLTDSPIGDIFTPAITNIIDNFYKDQAYKKYIMMQFHYSDDKFQIREISPGYKYVLMKHFRELICHIHEINPEKLDSSLIHGLSLHSDFYAQTEEGKELLQAINAAHVFTKAHPNWFDEMYGSDEDRCDSGLCSLPVESFPDHLKEQIQRECLNNLRNFQQQNTGLAPNIDLNFLQVPRHDNFDAHSITQSQITFEPPGDLYSISTEMAQPERPSLPCQIGHQVGGHPLDGLTGNFLQHYLETHGLHSTPFCPTDSGRNSQYSNSSQAQSSIGPFNISGETASFSPPADDTDSNNLQNALLGAHCEPGHMYENTNGDVPRLILADNLSWDGMSV